MSINILGAGHGESGISTLHQGADFGLAETPEGSAGVFKCFEVFLRCLRGFLGVFKVFLGVL